jgi:hypothetical protein
MNACQTPGVGKLGLQRAGRERMRTEADEWTSEQDEADEKVGSAVAGEVRAVRIQGDGLYGALIHHVHITLGTVG